MTWDLKMAKNNVTELDTKWDVALLAYQQKNELLLEGDCESSTEGSEDPASDCETKLPSTNVPKEIQKYRARRQKISILGENNNIFEHCRFKVFHGADKENLDEDGRSSARSQKAVGSWCKRNLPFETQIIPPTDKHTKDQLFDKNSSPETKSLTYTKCSFELQLEQIGRELGKVCEEYNSIKPHLTKVQQENKQLVKENELLKYKIVELKNKYETSEDYEDQSADLVENTTVQSSVIGTPSKKGYGVQEEEFTSQEDYSSAVVFFILFGVSCIVYWYYFGVPTYFLTALIGFYSYLIVLFLISTFLAGSIFTIYSSLFSSLDGYDSNEINNNISIFESTFKTLHSSSFDLILNSILAHRASLSDARVPSLRRHSRAPGLDRGRRRNAGKLKRKGRVKKLKNRRNNFLSNCKRI